jgi:hypothetical protein
VVVALVPLLPCTHIGSALDHESCQDIQIFDSCLCVVSFFVIIRYSVPDPVQQTQIWGTAVVMRAVVGLVLNINAFVDAVGWSLLRSMCSRINLASCACF